MKKSAVVVLAMLATALVSEAQQGGHRSGARVLIDTSEVITFTGTVVSFTAGLGQGMPELAVTDTDMVVWTLDLGPYPFLVDSGFSAVPGDAVAVTAYACTSCESGLAVAEVVNLTVGVRLVLRDAGGHPLWTGGSLRQHLSRGGVGSGTGSGQGQPGGQGQQGGQGHQGGQGLHGGLGYPDVARTANFVGTVVAFDLTAGAGSPVLTLLVGEVEMVFVVSPAWVLREAGFEPVPGQPLEVSAAPVEIDGSEIWLVLVIHDPATGIDIVVRDPGTGLPPSGKGRR